MSVTVYMHNPVAKKVRECPDSGVVVVTLDDTSTLIFSDYSENGSSFAWFDAFVEKLIDLREELVQR